MANWQKIGKIGQPRALGGEFFLLPFRASLQICDTAVMGEDPSSGIPVSIEKKYFQKQQWILKIRGIGDRKALKEIQGQILWCDLGKDSGDSYEGLLVYDQEGRQCGQIVAVSNYGASDIAVIENSEGKLLDLPLVESYFSFEEDKQSLKLLLPNEDLEDLWYD